MSRNRGWGGTTWKGPTSVLPGDLAKGARQKAGGGEETRAGRLRKRMNTQQTHGAHQKGYPTEHAERTDHMEWRTIRRGQGTPRQGYPPQAPRERRGRDGKVRGEREGAPDPLF